MRIVIVKHYKSGETVMINTYGLELNPPVEENKVRKVEIELGVTFPNDYIEFISFSNGAEGSIGENYLILWSIDEIIELNEVYGVNDFAKGFVLFGSDGGDTAFAFDTRTKDLHIVTVPFIGMDIEEVKTCSNTFNGFFQYLLNTN
jgi:hypothetical protein